MTDITQLLKEGVKYLDPIQKVFVSSKHFSLFDSISAIQIDKENMDNFIHHHNPSSNYIYNYEFTECSKVFKFTREIMIRIFQHLIKATSLSQTLFANRLVNSNLNSIIITSAKIVYEGSFFITQNSSNYLLHEDYFIENVDSSREYYINVQESELLQIIEEDSKFSQDVQVVLEFLLDIKNMISRIRNYDYKSVGILTLQENLTKIQDILQQQEEEEDVEFFDVDLNRNLYVQVQTKPAAFMGFKDLMIELSMIFKEWEWLTSKVEELHVNLWVNKTTYF